jgi:heterodisulfide reductase subunit A
VYRRSEQEMPAYTEEIQGAEREGIGFMFLTAPIGIFEKQGRITGVECIRTQLGPPDAGGRRRPVPTAGSEFVIPCDALIPAIGQKIHAPWANREFDLEWSPQNTLKVTPQTMQTSIPWVFAGGDAVTGPATVIEAVAAGHKAVAAIHRFINGEDLDHYAKQLWNREPPGRNWREIPRGLSRKPRTHPRHPDPELCATGFDEAEPGFSEIQAQQEARRCLDCGLCCECMECVRVCEAKAIDHGMTEQELEVNVGSIIIATGYDAMDPSPMKQFGYGRYPNVFTALEFERLSNATGPTGGEILIRDKTGKLTRTPESVAILHCIGSRDVNYHEYCSRVCCMYALKYAHLLHEKLGHQAQIFNFYIDMRCFGKGYEEFYERCQKEGTHFIRGKVAEITDHALTPQERGKLIAIAEDTLLGQRIRVPVDMVILCHAIQARSDAQTVGRIFGVNQGADGFFLEEHPKLGPLDTAMDGVFLAGACQGPKDIPDSVCQASGAAVKALALATRGKVEIAPVISWIDPDLCAGCRTCMELCPYSAIEYDARRAVSVVNEALCKGCGSCAGCCPSGAAQVKHFNQKQLAAELEGIIDSLDSVGI